MHSRFRRVWVRSDLRDWTVFLFIDRSCFWHNTLFWKQVLTSCFSNWRGMIVGYETTESGGVRQCALAVGVGHTSRCQSTTKVAVYTSAGVLWPPCHPWAGRLWLSRLRRGGGGCGGGVTAKRTPRTVSVQGILSSNIYSELLTTMWLCWLVGSYES